MFSLINKKRIKKKTASLYPKRRRNKNPFLSVFMFCNVWDLLLHILRVLIRIHQIIELIPTAHLHLHDPSFFIRAPIDLNHPNYQTEINKARLITLIINEISIMLINSYQTRRAKKLFVHFNYVARDRRVNV